MEDLKVPIEWAGMLILFIVMSFAWWVKREFDKNDREHDRSWRSILYLHKRLDLMGFPRIDDEEQVSDP